MRAGVVMTILSFMGVVFSGCSRSPESKGLAYHGETRAERIQLLVDETWMDEEGKRQVSQEIFDSVYDIIDQAEEFILLDFFLVNDFLYEPGPGMTPLSGELTERLIAKRRQNPEVPIVFISDPVNHVYGSLPSPHFSALEKAGVRVVWTELDELRDSNPLYSKPWRLLMRPWGVAPGRAVQNPMGDGRISVRSMMKLLNFKANHRKLIVTEKSLLVASANPHSASSAHWNTAFRIDGAGMRLACESESAILQMAGEPAFRWKAKPSAVPEGEGCRVELMTEIRIKQRVLQLLSEARPGDRIDLTMFYFSDRDVSRALINAQKRGCSIRVILDPSKDAFGRIKNGIPNRQTAGRLVRNGVALRWADTHGEQCHAKMLYVGHADGTATLVLGSCNYTRRNMDNYNAECDVAVTAPRDHATMTRCRDVFDRWWSNPDGSSYTVDYSVYHDPSLRRRLRAWLMERTGLATF